MSRGSGFITGHVHANFPRATYQRNAILSSVLGPFVSNEDLSQKGAPAGISKFFHVERKTWTRDRWVMIENSDVEDFNSGIKQRKWKQRMERG